MRCDLGTANKHLNSKLPGQDLMSEIGSHPVRKVIIIVIKIIIILALFKGIHGVALHLLQMLFYKAILFFSPLSIV